MHPEKSLFLKKVKCIYGNQSKFRITGMLSNALGDKTPMFAIGKSLNPCCLKGVSNPRRRYCAQRKAWMNSNSQTRL